MFWNDILDLILTEEEFPVRTLHTECLAAHLRRLLAILSPFACDCTRLMSL